MLDQRGRLLRAALGFAGLPRPSYNRSLWALRTWLDSWAGMGRIAVGMTHQGFDLQLTRYDETGEYEVIGRPYTTAAGKNAHVRVRRVDNAEVTMIRSWGAHERIAARRS